MTPPAIISNQSRPKWKNPIGFALSSENNNNPFLTITSGELTDLRVPGRDAPRVDRRHPHQCRFLSTLGHLVAPMACQNQREIRAGTQSEESADFGKWGRNVGTPRNWTHSMTGNSTEQ
jgi:hypothetical protein